MLEKGNVIMETSNTSGEHDRSQSVTFWVTLMRGVPGLCPGTGPDRPAGQDPAHAGQLYGGVLDGQRDHERPLVARGPPGQE